MVVGSDNCQVEVEGGASLVKVQQEEGCEVMVQLSSQLAKTSLFQAMACLLGRRSLDLFLELCQELVKKQCFLHNQMMRS